MKKKIAAGLVVLVAGAGWLAYSYFAAGEPGVRFEKIKVQKEGIRQTVLATGIVQPQNRLEIKPPIAGRVESVLVKEGQSVRKGQMLAWLSSTERAALLDAARAKGKEELDHWKEVYKPTPVVAPLTGLIISRRVEPGQTVTSNDPVLVMSDRLIVKAQVDETDIGQVKVGQGAKIVLDAYSSESIFADVDHIAFEAKTTSNVTTYEVEVVPKQVPDFMKSGMTANVSFVIAVRDDALVVPADAVKQDEGEPYVLLPNVTEDTKPARREVKIGITDGKRVEIVSGLKEGDEILIAKRDFKGRGAKKGTNPFAPVGGGGGGRGRQGGGGGRHP